jgi:hypothetical protein
VKCQAQCCGIPDPKTATKQRDEKKFVVLPFFVATNITKIILFYF